MAGPTKQADVVFISETYGTPDNFNRAHPFATTLTYTGGALTRVDESLGGVLRKRTTLSYTDEVLTSVNEQIYGLDGVAVEMEYIDTLNYTDGTLTSVTRTVVS